METSLHMFGWVILGIHILDSQIWYQISLATHLFKGLLVSAHCDKESSHEFWSCFGWNNHIYVYILVMVVK